MLAVRTNKIKKPQKPNWAQAQRVMEKVKKDFSGESRFELTPDGKRKCVS